MSSLVAAIFGTTNKSTTRTITNEAAHALLETIQLNLIGIFNKSPFGIDKVEPMPFCADDVYPLLLSLGRFHLEEGATSTWAELTANRRRVGWFLRLPALALVLARITEEGSIWRLFIAVAVRMDRYITAITKHDLVVRRILAIMTNGAWGVHAFDVVTFIFALHFIE